MRQFSLNPAGNLDKWRG